MRTFTDQRIADFFRSNPGLAWLLRIQVRGRDTIVAVFPKFAAHCLEGLTDAMINAVYEGDKELDGLDDNLFKLFPDFDNEFLPNLIHDAIHLFRS